MILSEAIDLIHTIMGFRSDLADKIKTQLTLAQAFFQKGPTFPWFLLSEVATATTIVGDRRLAVPLNFLAEYEEGCLWYGPTDEDQIALVKEDYDYLNTTYGSISTGPPAAYSVDGSYFNLFPTPDDLYTMKLMYYKPDTKISSIGLADTCLWLTYASDCIIGRAGGVLASGLRDGVALERFSKMEQEGRLLLTNQNESKKHVNRSYQIGGPCR